MEGRVPDKPGHVQAAGDVLWTHEQSGNLPDDDERYLRGSDSGWPCMHLHGRHPCFRSNPDGTSSNHTPVLEAASSHKLYLKAEKCKFEREQVEYLGLIISHDWVVMDLVKVAAVTEWPCLRDRKEVQLFLGFVNFYQRFTERFSHIAWPMFDLTKKDTPFVWFPECDAANAALKAKVTEAPVLILLNERQPFRVKSDSSDFVLGGVLQQLSEEDGKWHPVVFLSKSLSLVEQNYEVHDKELLAVMRSLEQWQHFLEGAKHPVKIWTNHKNLESFRTAQNLNRRQAWWSLYLSRFDYSLHH